MIRKVRIAAKSEEEGISQDLAREIQRLQYETAVKLRSRLQKLPKQKQTLLFQKIQEFNKDILQNF